MSCFRWSRRELSEISTNMPSYPFFPLRAPQTGRDADGCAVAFLRLAAAAMLMRRSVSQLPQYCRAAFYVE